MAITSTTCEQFQRMASSLQPIAEVLLAGPNEFSAHLPLERQPLPWRDFLLPWQERSAKSDATSRAEILKTYAAILEELWEAQGSLCAGRAYESGELWLRTHTLTGRGFRPAVTLKTLWFVAAVHNWLWWHRNAEQLMPPEIKFSRVAEATDSGGAVAADPTTPVVRDEAACNLWLDAQLNRDVDPFLSVLHRSEKIGLGDLVAMHLIAVNLGRFVHPAAPATAQISVTPHGTVGRARYQDPTVAAGLPKPQAARLVNIQMTSPISRFAAIGTEEQAYLARDLASGWRWMDKLLGEPSAAGLRQYLASNLGEHFVHGPPEGVSDLLRLLDALSEVLKTPQLAQGVKESIQEFIAQVLWATVSDPSADGSRTLWARWVAGYPRQFSVAQWCGRVARWAESKVASRSTAQLPELASIWLDLARATLQHWLSGRDHSVLCLGLWLSGYLENAVDRASSKEDRGERSGEKGTPPKFVLGRRACGQTLDQVASCWWVSAERQCRGVRSAGSLSGLIDSLMDAMKKNTTFLTICPEAEVQESSSAGQAAEAPPSTQPTGEPLPPAPGVKLYCYTPSTNKGDRDDLDARRTHRARGKRARL